MPDRFQQTATDAEAAIADARRRAAAARERRQELERRLEALRGPRYVYEATLRTITVAVARERLEAAQASSRRARERAEHAWARAGRPTF
jgi:hypothetical protein